MQTKSMVLARLVNFEVTLTNVFPCQLDFPKYSLLVEQFIENKFEQLIASLSIFHHFLSK